ncbi:WXG100 family type VII secretion target [Streptomyces sp. NRRL WC-3742]|uniref:WXG100 family type VII secretion target n=1 Tax=Streptomyces sp. NRRL WC-3742 TaxID=1463934 RepID=UPI0004C9C445|nr:WXG100 family type VII secretion target [Streptomyces sp. NRRL WC-3742]
MGMDNFGSIQLHHESIEQAQSELAQAGGGMSDSLQAVMNQLTHLTESGQFQGAAATAFTNFQQVVNRNAQAMNDDIIAAAGRLGHMHETMIQADQDGRKQFN